MVTPQGAAKAAVKEVAEKATEELATHADDLANTAKKVIDTATEAPTPPTQLANDIAAAPAAAKPPLPGVDTPKAPNAPPSADVVPGGELAHPLPPAAADRRLTTDITSRAPLRKDTKADIHAAARRDPDTGLPIDPNTREPIHGTPDVGHKPGFEEKTTNDMVTQYGLSRREKLEWSNDPSHYRLEAPGSNRSHQYESPRSASHMYDDYKDWLQKNMQTNPKLAQDPTAQRRLANIKSETRPTGAAQQRQIQETSVRQSTNSQRDAARQSAQEANQSNTRSSSQGEEHHDNGSSHKKRSNSKKKKKKSSQHHPKPKG
ncbi:HNH/ENDO VII family nuclease [Mycobacterium hackensackense]|nr:HNH/ENDO VII family nuclease [Mycobacterium hackensackense]